jgi:hypothetical protein
VTRPLSAAPAESDYVNVQFCPCGHVCRMLRSDLIEREALNQQEEIDAGNKLDAVILRQSDCPDCKDEDERQARRYAEMDVLIEKPRCHTCHATDTILDDSWGPFCVGADCRQKAEGAADEASVNRYI